MISTSRRNAVTVNDLIVRTLDENGIRICKLKPNVTVDKSIYIKVCLRKARIRVLVEGDATYHVADNPSDPHMLVSSLFIG